MAENNQPRIGVFLCHCGTNIAGSLSINDIIEYAKTLPYVVHSDEYQYMCSTPGQGKIVEAIAEHNLTGIVVAACTPSLHEPTFRVATKEGGLNPFRFEMANIREQNSWVHMHGMWDEATSKAKDQVRMAVAKAALLEDLIPKSVPVEPAAMVVGAGVGGIQAALDLASAGIKTYLVERTPTVGGRMSQLDKTFPTLDCSQCILTPKMVDVGRHPNIELLTYHEVESVEGYIGNFEVTLKKKARGVLSPEEGRAIGVDGCNGCGDCAEVCPVIKPNPFEMGMAPRKAIYIYHAQVMPLIFTIDFDSCVKCNLCVDICGTKKAIDLEMKDEFPVYKIGTVILATGFELIPIEEKKEWGYKRYENVIHGLEFERLICASGPTGGHLIRPSDGATPKRVGFVLCAGSRDNAPGIGKPYCSRFCCMYSLKHAHQIMEKIEGVEPYIFYMDIRSFGKMYEEFYYRIQNEGAKFIRGRVANILEDPKTKNLHVFTEDTLLGRPVDIELDLVVLASAVKPNDGADVVRKKFGVSASQDGWMLEAHPKLNPCGTTTAGVFLAGVCQGPKDIPDTVAQAEGAASAASIPIHCGEVELEPYFAICLEDLCAGCGMCTNLCPYSALALTIKNDRMVMEVTEAKCKGCGTCGGFCPGGAIKMQHFTSQQIVAQIDAYLLGGE
ncbi:MAG: CoB--CoM heterodisulfide reductase iron-sulfur subunit A family protein [Methanomicrobiales archaeon]|jgi:heterodisulfide reductase subunit A|nr:CoB--CoM heterodisulfide reductase iron-sulfur subunit A family protein [Methanomicrobiales archaeon]